MKHEAHIMVEFISRVGLGCEIYPEKVEQALVYMESGNGGFNEPHHKALIGGIRECLRILEEEE